MMRKALSWFMLLTVSALLSGCGSGGIEPGFPTGPEATKVTDPMAGTQIKPIGKAAKKAAR